MEIDYSACGKRPIFCGKKRDEYNKCIQEIANENNMGLVFSTTPFKKFVCDNKTPLIISGAILTAGIVYFITRKK
jgi:hypothetical protein